MSLLGRPAREEGTAPHRLPVHHAPLVVAQARLIVGEEHLPDEVPSTANARLLEHALQVLLHGVGGDAQVIGDLRSGVAAKDQTGDVLLALGQLVGGHEQRRDTGRMGGLDDDGYTPRAIGYERGPVEHYPPPFT